jgi:hypothetical protein
MAWNVIKKRDWLLLLMYAAYEGRRLHVLSIRSLCVWACIMLAYLPYCVILSAQTEHAMCRPHMQWVLPRIQGNVTISMESACRRVLDWWPNLLDLPNLQRLTTLTHTQRHTNTHTHTLLSTATSSLSLLGSGFQTRTLTVNGPRPQLLASHINSSRLNLSSPTTTD